jgi:predicted neutral ceramidase superfamily lipid hydrolase
MGDQKLNEAQMSSIRKSLLRSRIILVFTLAVILAIALVGVNDGLGKSPDLGLLIIANALVVAIFAAIWFWSYSRHQKISKGLPQETYTMFEGVLESATSNNNSLMFQINGVKHFTSTQFRKSCIRGNRVRLYKTDKSRIYFQVDNI